MKGPPVPMYGVMYGVRPGILYGVMYGVRPGIRTFEVIGQFFRPTIRNLYQMSECQA